MFVILENQKNTQEHHWKSIFSDRTEGGQGGGLDCALKDSETMPDPLDPDSVFSMKIKKELMSFNRSPSVLGSEGGLGGGLALPPDRLRKDAQHSLISLKECLEERGVKSNQMRLNPTNIH